MTRLAIYVLIAFGFTAPAPAAEIVRVGTAKQLLIDDHVVEKLAGLTRAVEQPQRVSDKPILTAEHPWEGSVLQMPCVLWDPQLRIYHMYYWAVAGRSIYTCYARSTDGLRWKKPQLNLHAGPDGSKANNIVLRGEGPSARTRYVVINPRTDDPRRRFLALYIDNVPGLTEFAASSPDGLRWRTEEKIGDLRQTKGGKVTANPPFFLIEQQWAKDPEDGHRYRAIWRTESQDMKSWSGGRMVVERLPDDDPDLEFYHACSHFLGSQSYSGLHFGYLYLYHTDSERGVREDGVRLSGTVDTALMVSRDTIQWTRVDRSRRFFPLGPEGAWDGQMVYASPEVVIGDRMLFYYSGWKKEHGASDNEAAIGLATLPVDRFVAVQPTEHRGTLTTKPFVVEGEELRVNVDAAGGSLRVEVLREQGGPIASYDAASCQPLTKDELRASVKWGGRSLKALQGKTIRLRFQLDRARLFAFQLQPAAGPPRPSLRVHAFYYPWYGNPATDGRYANWNHAVAVRKGPPRQFPGGDDIGANFYPKLGCYSSNSAETLEQHMKWLQRARVGVICVSWWGRGSFTDRALPPLFRAAEKYGIRISFHIEPHIGPGGRNAQTTRDAIRYLLDRFGESPALYRDPARGKRALVYVYDSYLTKADEWATILSPDGEYTIRGTPYDVIAIGLWVKENEADYMLQSGFDGFYTYFATERFTYGSTPANWKRLARWAEEHGKIFIPCVGPGYVDQRIRPWNGKNTRGRKSGKYYDEMFRAAVAVSPPFVGITSFNQWHEGTQIEPTVPKKIDGYAYEDFSPLTPEHYLDRTARWVERYESAPR